MSSFFININDRSQYFQAGLKQKCYGCRANGLPMPNPPVDTNDTGLLECGCEEEGALVEAIYVELGIIGLEVAKKETDSDWKALSRPERERILKILKMLELELDSLLEFI